MSRDRDRPPAERVREYSSVASRELWDVKVRSHLIQANYDFMSCNAEPVIREAEPGDAHQIGGLLTQLGYPSSRDDVARRLAYWLPDPMSLILVAEQGGHVLGCLSLHAIPYLERTGRWARIESLVVDQSSRGRGTGRALVAAAEANARAWNCLAIEVTSLRERVGAHAFYQRMGYTDVCGNSGRFVKTLDHAEIASASSRPSFEQ